MPLAHGFTANDQTLILSGNFDIHLWLRIYHPVSSVWAFRDISSILGYDPTVSARVSYDVDSPSGTVEITVQLVNGGTTLSPFIMPSSINLGSEEMFRPGKLFELYAAVTPKGAAQPAKSPWPPSGYPTVPDYTWHRMAGGRIDNVNMEGDDLTLQCRTYEWLLLDRFIETVTKYGGGDPAETVMQDILTDWTTANPLPGGTPAFYTTLVTPSSPSWALNDYAQQEQPIIEALRVIAQQIGWDVRFFETDGIGNPDLRFYDPDRSGYTPGAVYAYDINKTFYYKFAPVTLNGDDIRNVIEGRLSADKLIYTVSSSTSITKYGRRYMRIVEDANSNIDTVGELTAMLNMVLSDLEAPRAAATVECPFYPVALNAILRVNGDDIIYKEYLFQGHEFTIVGVTYDFNNGGATTTIQLREAAAVTGSRWWLQQEGAVKEFIETTDPTPSILAPEGSLWVKVADLDFPP